MRILWIMFLVALVCMIIETALYVTRPTTIGLVLWVVTITCTLINLFVAAGSSES